VLHTSDAQGSGFDALCCGLGYKVEDGWFDTFVPHEDTFKPEEDEVDDDSVNQSCESKYHKSATKSSPEANCSTTSQCSFDAMREENDGKQDTGGCVRVKAIGERNHFVTYLLT
jgi:hypothetical protein